MRESYERLHGPSGPERRGSPRTHERRTRVVLVVLGLAGLWTLAEVVLVPTFGLAHVLAVLALRIGVLFIAAGVFPAMRAAWHGRLRALVQDGMTAFTAWSRRWWPTFTRTREHAGLRLGERLALVAGIFVAVLDVVLTSLLLRDVFPEPPYRLPLAAAWLGPALAEGSFYVAVASLKTALALWFGMFERTHEGGEPGRLRWFVLGSASAFDAVLAIVRGLGLAEQGMGGAPVMVSNVVFVGFGIAVPWVVAHTGRLLALAVDPLLARFSLVRVLATLPVLALVGAAWLVVLVLAIPAAAIGLVLALATALWFAIEDTAALLLGQEPLPPPTDARLERILTESDGDANPHALDSLDSRPHTGLSASILAPLPGGAE